MAPRAAEFAIADEIERLGVFGHAALQQCTHFVEPAAGKHRIGSRMNAQVECFARRRQSDLQRAPALQRRAGGAVHFRERFLREKTNFDGANEFLLIGRRDLAGGFWVQARQHPMQMARRMFRGASAQPFAQILGPVRNIRQTFEECSQV